jgi:ComF family protein
VALLDAVRGIGLPSRCAACRAWGRSPLCAECEWAIVWIGGESCAKCGKPEATPVPRCQDCRGRDLAFDRARAAVSYEGPAREVVKAFKIGGERRIAKVIARWMVPAALSLGAVRCVTWVPSTRRSDAVRGFTPAEELARPLARALGLPAARLLNKIRATRDQSELSGAQRRANLADAFAARTRVPERVLLVDDIMTTGATAQACATALKLDGARRVVVVTFARAP